VSHPNFAATEGDSATSGSFAAVSMRRLHPENATTATATAERVT